MRISKNELEMSNIFFLRIDFVGWPGGVFIATLIGLALAMVALAAEVLYYKRGKNSLVSEITPRKSIKMIPEKSHVSRINVTPVY